MCCRAHEFLFFHMTNLLGNLYLHFLILLLNKQLTVLVTFSFYFREYFNFYRYNVREVGRTGVVGMFYHAVVLT